MISNEEAIEKASRCLGCKIPLCKKGCPIQTNIPEFIQKIKENELNEAYRILQENNIMSEVCSLVCPYENYCMGNCVRGIKGQPVEIPILEQYVNNWAETNNIKYEHVKAPNNNIKIAIIGSGPAGISCARELAVKGFDVTIFEKENKIGGTVTFGIPNFRVRKEFIDNIHKKIIDLGIKIKFNLELGKDFNINELRKEGYKAIFIAIGANSCSTYKLSENENLPIYKANEVLKAYNINENKYKIKNAVIIGGGNVAIDVARVLKKLGSNNVTIIYRRSKKQMPARDIEIEEALSDGVDIIYNTRVIGVEEKDNQIKNLQCIKTETNNDKIEDVIGSEFLFQADSVIFAIGLRTEKELMNMQNIQTLDGYVVTDENMMTNQLGVFAGGDITQRKPTVCLAIQSGKKAANSIEKYINKLK